MVGVGGDLAAALPHFVFFLCLHTPPLTFKVYLRDSFGLKTLLARGAIVRCPMAGISHTTWHSNRTLYDTCIEPWLS